MKKNKKAAKSENLDKKNKNRKKSGAPENGLPAGDDMSMFAPEQITASAQAPVRPQPRAKSKASGMPPSSTVMPVAGGLEPIIAPKGHVQLNPVVIPVAFVPYSTQNQGIYQTDGMYGPEREEIGDQPRDRKRAAGASKKDKAAWFAEDVEGAKPTKVKASTLNRVFAALMLVGGLVFFLFELLKGFADKLPDQFAAFLGSGDFDLVGGWSSFINVIKNRGEIYSSTLTALVAMSAVAVMVLACLIVSIVSLANGRGYHVWIAYMLCFLISLVILLLGVLPKGKPILRPLAVELNPAGPDGFHCQICIILAALTILGLIFWPRKSDEDEDKTE